MELITIGKFIHKRRVDKKNHRDNIALPKEIKLEKGTYLITIQLITTQ